MTFCLFSVTNKSEYYILQFDATRGAAGEEDNGAGLLLLLYSREDGPGASEPRFPRLPRRAVQEPRLLGPVHEGHRRPGGERRHQFRFPENGRDVPAPDRQVGPVRPLGHCDQPNHVRGPLRPAPHRARARHRD